MDPVVARGLRVVFVQDPFVAVGICIVVPGLRVVAVVQDPFVAVALGLRVVAVMEEYGMFQQNGVLHPRSTVHSNHQP